VKVLQLTSDWKWTGPAEPMLRLALALRARGHEVEIACAEPPGDRERSVASEARAAGLAPAFAATPRGGFHPLRELAGARALRAFLRARRFDVVHCWHTHDHRAALLAAEPLRRAHGLALVRSHRVAGPIARTPWNRLLFGPGCDGLLLPSPRSAEANRGLRGARPLAGSFGAVDLARFAPRPPDPTVRAGLGLAPEHRVVGIVARVQRQRRFDLLLDAARRLFARDPAARLVVLGRGTRIEELGIRPAAALGIADRILWAGHRRDDYVAVLQAFDVFTFLVPGSDGTCRAVLEAAACGIPAVVTRRGALPEIVLDGETGRVVDEDPEALAAAWCELLSDTERRRALGAAAAARARACFGGEQLVETVLRLYREALAPPA
jgi:glycosyltransferase involved in cell wall biosynthesis